MRDVDPRWMSQRLVNNAIALGQFEKRGYLFVGRVGVEIESQSNVLKTDRRFFGNAQRAAKIEIALSVNGCIAKRDFERGRDCTQSNACAGNERFKQHVA